MKFLIFFLLSLPALAEDVLHKECTEAAVRFGNGLGDDYISKDCFDWVKTSKTDESSFSVPEKIQIIGHENIIFISEFKEGKYLTHIMAGVYSGIKKVKALAASLEHRELYVLQDQEVLVYSMDITGNVGPMRRWKIKGLEAVKSIKFDQAQDEIVIAHSAGEKAFPRLTK
jgi:hypothetical protein